MFSIISLANVSNLKLNALSLLKENWDKRSFDNNLQDTVG